VNEKEGVFVALLRAGARIMGYYTIGRHSGITIAISGQTIGSIAFPIMNIAIDGTTTQWHPPWQKYVFEGLPKCSTENPS
jgi:hypothetical protein